MNLTSKRSVVIAFLMLLLVIAGCGGGGGPPTKTVEQVTNTILSIGENDKEHPIIDSQGNVLYTKTIKESGGPLSDLFIHDDDILGGFSTISEFISDQGANVAGGRISDYYPIDIDKLLNGRASNGGFEKLYQVEKDSSRPSNIVSSYAPSYSYDTAVYNENNIFVHDFWINQEGLKRLLQFEKEEVGLSESWYAIGEKEKEFAIEDDRICFQGGKMTSSLHYYRSENSGCYGSSDAQCEPHFNTFPLFKTCSSLSNLKDTVSTPSDWDEYSVSCNFNSRFSTIPSFFENVNMGYSHCLLKNLNESEESILFGYSMGNPYIEKQSGSLDLSVEELFPRNTITNQNTLDTQTITVKAVGQEAIYLGKSFSKHTGYSYNDATDTYSPTFNNVRYNGERYDYINTILEEKFLKSSLTGNHDLIGTKHLGDHQDKVTGNYIMVESFREVEADVERYEVTLENDDTYYVYKIPYTSWFAISTSNEDISQIYNEYTQNPNLPKRSAERILHSKVENGKTYTLTEESETLKYKSNLYNPSGGTYTTSPVYILKITNSASQDCDTYFNEYNYESSSSLSNSNAVSCEVSGGVLRAELNEKVFSEQFSPENEWGFGYIVLRNIMYPN